MGDLYCSVIIPTYNREKFVRSAIESVLPQLLPGDELIVVDDASTDNTQDVLECFADKIIMIQSEHVGAGIARNIGIKAARNQLVAFLDSDDTWLPEKLNIQRKFMEATPSVLYCFADFRVKMLNGQIVSNYLRFWPKENDSWEEIFGEGEYYSKIAELPRHLNDFKVYQGDLYRWQLTGLYVLTDTVMVRREAAGEALHFAEDLPTGEDVDCYSRLSKCGKAAYLDIEMACQYAHNQGRLSQKYREMRSARIEIVKKYWGSDDEFLSSNQELYDSLIKDWQTAEIKDLILLDSVAEARVKLAKMKNSPLSLIFITNIPGVFRKPLVWVYRTLKRSSIFLRRSARHRNATLGIR